MKEEIDFSAVPYRYIMCLNSQCPQASTCLRQLAEQSVPPTQEHWNYLNPKYLATLKGACPHYRSCAKVKYAIGFLDMMDNLPHKQMQSVALQLISLFSRRTYYRIRKGERLISPSEQQIILAVLKQCGVTSPRDFDAYTEDYEW